MSYIVPSELPKSCRMCPYCCLIMQNPLSSKTPIKRYRCQVGKAPWKTFDVDFHDDEYKNKDCPLVPLERIVKRLEALAERERATSEKAAELVKDYEQHMILHGAKGIAFEFAVDLVREEGGLNEEV